MSEKTPKEKNVLVPSSTSLIDPNGLESKRLLDRMSHDLLDLSEREETSSSPNQHKNYPNGDKYYGQLKDGKRHGKGTITSSGGQKYVGYWKDDQYHGKGTYTWPSGQKYVGDWKDGKQHGKGTLTYPDGQKYVGDWKDDKQHGKGTYTYPNGEKYVGDWKDGEFIG